MPFRPLLWLLCCSCLGAAAQPRPSLVPYTDGTRWGYADTTGQVVIPQQWTGARFFQDQKAVVVIRQDYSDPRKNGYALIDEGGHYLIPPEAGWTGNWAGSWGSSGINAVDSTGRGGIIDLDGRLLLPYQWEAISPMEPPLADSFKIVYSDGLAGIIDRAGRLVVPCKWGQITATEALSPIRAFLVKDPDNMGGINSNGVADLQQRLLIPPRYRDITLLHTPDGRLLFQAVADANNEPGSNDYQRVGTVRYFAYPSGRQVAPPPPAAQADRPENPLPGGYIAFGKRFGGLMDARRKVLIPCCRFWQLRGDTAVLREEKRVGKDSVVLTITYLDVHTLRLVAKPLQLMLYSLEAPKPQRGYYHPDGYSGRSSVEAAVVQLPEYGAVERFYKDSFLFTADRYADPGRKYVVVAGESRTVGSRYGYEAVVDSALNYVIPPQRQYRILSYDGEEQLAVAEGHSERYGASGQTVLTPDGRELMRPLRGQVAAPFRWQGRVYLYLKVQDECNPEPSGTHNYLTDITGTPVPALTPYELSRYYPSRMDGQRRTPRGGVWVTDTAGRIGLLFPDGQPVYPALNFRYRSLTPTYNGLFFVTDAGRQVQRLMDTANNQVPGAIAVYTIEPAKKPVDPYDPVHAYQTVPVPRLYGATGTDASGKAVHFYLDDTGRAYYTAP